MNGPSKLSLAIALALIGGNAFALGLGSIQVKSGLNQPLDAEIAVTTEAPGEAAGINVSMATAEDFDRVGLNRTRVSVPIDFAVSTNSRGQAVIKLSTKEAVREPFLDFLIQVNWPKGKLLREYTVLLDPPVTAPAVRGAPATVTPAKESAAAPPQKLTVQEKQTKTKTTTVKPPRVAAEPKAPPAPKPSPAPSATPRTAAAGDYGPVAEGETLSEVARATRPDEATNVNQMMLALLKANPNAFYKDNINALKRGAILRIPSGDELKANGNAAAVAAAVREQNEAWSSGAAVAKPTVVANTGAPKSAPAAKPEPKSSTKSNEHLALVPPRAGKEGQNTADRPGPTSGTGSGDSKAELARTKEALASREQEAAELKSRVKQLEDLNSKDQRLLTLKESEIADLQAKLKELQSKSAATTATKPATPTPTPTPPSPSPSATTPAPSATTSTTKPADTSTKPGDTKLTAQDIWGNIAATEKAGSKPATPGTTPSATTPPSSTPTPAPSTTPPSTATTSTTAPSTSTTPSVTPSATTGSTTPSTAPSASTTTPSSTASSTTTPPASTTGTTTSTGTTITPVTTPTTSAPTTLGSTTPSTTPSASSKPATPTTTPKPTPVALTNEQPWYQNNMVLLAGGIGLLLIGVLALMRFMRKPKPVLMPIEGGADLAEEPLHGGDEEHHLLDALAQSPGDAHLSLELLNLYYQQRDAAKFEAAAEAMYAHIADPTQPEWQQVKAMGEELCPHNPLFSGSDLGLGGGRAQDTVFGHYDAGTAHAQEDAFDLGGHDGHETKHAAAEENFDFDLTDHAAAAPAPAHDMDFAHPPPPAPAPAPAPVTVRAPVHAPAPVAPPPPKPAEDFFAGEDAIGTKLDLAKAYLDMGDPEGARSMLDEVMAEGNDAQKGEARKLLAEIR